MTTSSASYKTAKKFPTIGFYLSLLGALLILAQALAAMFFNSIYIAFVINLGAGIAIFFVGVLLLLDALIIGSSAYSLRAYPNQRVIAGGTIVLFAFLALFLGGGFIIGSVLGIIGGLLAMINI
jgi:hypothetical protein